MRSGEEHSFKTAVERRLVADRASLEEWETWTTAWAHGNDDPDGGEMRQWFVDAAADLWDGGVCVACRSGSAGSSWGWQMEHR